MQTEPRILRSRNGSYPAGPRGLANPFVQDPVAMLAENARRYGDLVHYRSLNGHVFQFNHPALIQELLIEHEKRIGV